MLIRIDIADPYKSYINGLVQDCSISNVVAMDILISSALAMEILQSRTKSLISSAL